MSKTSYTLPIFQYPTITVWLDDDNLFLETAKLTFQEYSNQHLFFNNPQRCLDFLETHVHKNQITKKNFIRSDRNHEQFGLLKHMPVDFNITNIAELQNDASRFQEISLLIIDHNMPMTKGLDICYKLKNLPFKKILLTGEAQDKEIISAFNDGVINYFFRKDDLNFLMDIQIHINKLAQQYFCEQTAYLLSYLETDNPLPLSDEKFVLFFEKIKAQKQIKEFYLIDKNGSFLLIDKQDKKYFLIVHTDRSLNNFCRIHSDICVIKELMQETMQRNKIPFFGLGKEIEQINPENWSEHFYKPSVLETSREKYYWAIICCDNNN